VRPLRGIIQLNVHAHLPDSLGWAVFAQASRTGGWGLPGGGGRQ